MDLIVTHTGGDFDSLASLVAAKKIYPQARLLFPGSPEKSVREFLSLGRDLVNIENEKDINFQNINRLIIVDTRLKNRIGRAGGLTEDKKIQIHIYDHHPKTNNDIKADFEISKKTGATVTILIDLIRKKKINLTPLEATIMALGIYEDTGSLTFRTTAKEDIDAVSFLFERGADLAVVASYLSRELSDEQLSILISLMQAAETYLINGIKVAISNIETPRYIGDFSVLVHKLIDIENINVFFVIAKIQDTIHLISRSRIKNVEVDKIMRTFGGSGHSSAASAVIKGGKIDCVKKNLLGILKEKIHPPVCAKDIMSFPVKTVTPEQIINDVKKTMIRYNIGAMPVVKNRKVIGLITQGDMDKAIYHGFGHSRVKGYMSRNVISAAPDAPVYELQKIIFKENIGRLVILKRGHLAGIVARSDLLRSVHEELMASMEKFSQTEINQTEVLLKEDTASLLKKKLPAEIFGILTAISETALKNKVNVYLVGGFVRDLLLHVKNFDIDIVVEGSGVEFAKKLARVFKGRLIIHERFQTAILVLKLPGLKNYDKEIFKIDIATARTEYYEFPAALPKVELSSLKKDLYRRDFTINAMAISLNKDNFGLLFDFFGGLNDLKRGVLKVLHNLSFVEDPTRIFRAVRFEQRYNLKIEKQTEELIKTAVDMEMLKRVAGERLREEIIYILSEKEPCRGIRRMARLHELRFIHKDINWTLSLENFLKKVQREIEWFQKISNAKIEKWLIYFSALLKDLNYEEQKKVCQKFMFSGRQKGKILASRENECDSLTGFTKKGKQLPSRMCSFFAGRSLEELILINVKVDSAFFRKNTGDFITVYSKIKPSLTGEDLKKLGLKPSPFLGEILKRVREAKIDGLLKSKTDELNFARKLLDEVKR